MKQDLEHFLRECPRTAADLARLLGKSVSAVYKALKEHDEVRSGDNPNGAGQVFWLPNPAQAHEDGPGTTESDVSTNPTGEPDILAPEPLESVLEGEAKRGRKSWFVGKSLRAMKSNNPRRKDSHGFRSMQIVIDQPGISYEDYLAAGGRLVDLRWDVLNGNIKAQ